jgi:hypothetical protein
MHQENTHPTKWHHESVVTQPHLGYDQLIELGPDSSAPRGQELYRGEPVAEKGRVGEYDQLRADLLATTDWDRLIGDYANGQQQPDAAKSLWAFNVRSGGNPPSLLLMAEATDELRRFQADVDVLDYALPRGERYEVPEGWEENPHLAEAIDGWTESAEAVADKFLATSRKGFVYGNIPYDEFDRLKDLCKAIGLGDGEAFSGIPRQVVFAIDQRSRGLISEFNERDMANIDAHARQHPDLPVMRSHRLLPRVTDIDDPKGWLDARMSRFPAWMLHGLALVEFKAHMGTIDTGAGVLPLHGLMFPDEKKVQVNLHPETLAEVVDNNPDADVAALERHAKHINRLHVGDTFDHELMHYVHYYRLPVSWLMDWQEISKAEKVHVTQYVASMHEGGHQHTDAENLTESARLYLNAPKLLLQKGSLRFMRLNDLFKAYSNQAIVDMHADIAFVERATRQRKPRVVPGQLVT